MPPVGPWNYWLIPLLKEKQAKDTALINAIGFVAACVDSEILRLHALREPELLQSLQETCQGTVGFKTHKKSWWPSPLAMIHR